MTNYDLKPIEDAIINIIQHMKDAPCINKYNNLKILLGQQIALWETFKGEKIENNTRIYNLIIRSL